MCGRFAMDDKVNAAITEWVQQGGRLEDWSVQRLIDWQPRYNIAPTQDAPLLYATAPGEATFAPAYWSLVPPKNPDMKVKFTFNAKSEKLLTNGLWRASFTTRRGIVLANGYYEWQGDKPPKTPYFIHDPAEPVLGFAALYAWWQEPSHRGKDDQGWHLTTTIVTSDAVQTLEDIHDRNPVILPASLWSTWIDPTIAGDQHLADEAVTAGVTAASELVADQVAPLRGDGPHLIQPAQ